MKLGTFAIITAIGVAGTSVAVWSSTHPSPAARKARIADPADPGAAPGVALPDRSSFEEGDTLKVESRLGHATVPAAADTETFLYVDVSADPTARASQRAPLNLGLVIDRSGSMKGKRLRNAVDAARTAVNRLADGDTVTVVAYNSRTEVLVSPTVIDDASRTQVLARLDRLRASGNTCISCGIETSMRLLRPDPAQINRIVLLSDGEATAGVRDVPGFSRVAERCRNMGVSVTTIGVDVDYNERIMAAIARESNGAHFFVERADELAAIFDKEMQRLTDTVALDAELVVDLSPGVFALQVFDRTFTRRGNRVVVPLGAFAKDDRKSLLMRVRLPRGPEGERPVAAVRLQYRDLTTDAPATVDGELFARASADPNDVSPLDGLVSARVTRSEAAAALEEANRLASAGDRGGARRVLQRQRRKLAATKSKAASAAPVGRSGSVTSSFESTDSILDSAGAGFDPAGDDRDNEAQIRANQAGAFDATE